MPGPIRAAALALCALAVVTAPAEASKPGGGPSGHGVVVAHQDADTFVLATRGGQLRTVDATSLPAVGSVVKVKTRRGVAKRIRVVGTATRAELEGSVTASAADRLTVTGKPDADARVEVVFAAPITQPALGQRVKVRVAIDGTTLRAQRVRSQGRGGSEVEGIVTAYDEGARTLTLAPEGGSPIVVAVPVSIDAVFTVGTKVELKVLLLADGTYVLQRVDDRGDDDDDDGGDDRGGRGCGGDDDDRKGRGRGSDDD